MTATILHMWASFSSGWSDTFVILLQIYCLESYVVKKSSKKITSQAYLNNNTLTVIPHNSTEAPPSNTVSINSFFFSKLCNTIS